jgi:hypothetical protein
MHGNVYLHAQYQKHSILIPNTFLQIHQVERRTMRIPRYLSAWFGSGVRTIAVEQSARGGNHQQPNRAVLPM